MFDMLFDARGKRPTYGAQLTGWLATLSLLGACGTDPQLTDSASESESESETDSETRTTTDSTNPTTIGPTMTGPTGSESESTTETGTESESETTQDPTETTVEPTTETNSETETTIDPPTTDPGCTDGLVMCDGDSASECVGGAWTDPVVCEHGCVDGEGCAEPCVEGSVICVDGGASTCVEGDYTDPEPCSDACVDELGCVACVPGSTTCEGGNSMMCDEDGQGYELSELCDGVQGVFCNEDVGVCDGDCAPDNLQLDYLGCEYYATVTQQYDAGIQGTDFFTITVSNTADVETDVTIDGNGVNLSFTVAPNSVVRQKLPWVNALYKGTGPSKVVSDGAYRIRANHPVTVIQYSPIDADVTNDASLLLPVNAWTGSAMVASYPFWVNQLNDNIRTPGFYAVTASQDNTTVQLSPSATGNVVQPGAGVAADGTGEVTLDRGDVLQVVTSLDAGDLTGTMIAADKPVQLIAGHSCTEVPQGDLACDHLEESMPPIEALSDTYVVMPPVQTPNNDMFHGEVVRVIASEPDTAVVFTPDIGQDITLENAGDFIDVPVGTQRYLVEADKKILVAQYMVGAQGGFGESDPSMALAVATGQYRKDFLIHAPPTWQANYANLIAPLGAMVEVDGDVVPEIDFTAIPETDYMTATVLLNNDGDGNHLIASDEKISVSVYGAQSFGSYWIVGGLDLNHF